MENKGFLLHRYGHFSGINRKVQMKYQPKGRPRGSSSDDGKDFVVEHFIFSTAASGVTTTTTTTAAAAAAAMNNSNNIRAVSIVIAFLHLCIRVSKISQPCCEWFHISRHGSITNDVTSPCSFKWCKHISYREIY
jgi:hypothetical protein